MKNLLRTIHEFITDAMAKSCIVENILIAKVQEVDEDGDLVTFDCIYCTILRVAMIFIVLGFILGYSLCHL